MAEYKLAYITTLIVEAEDEDEAREIAEGTFGDDWEEDSTMYLVTREDFGTMVLEEV